MADNYLERKMEEHRNGGASRYRPHTTPSGQRAGMLCQKFPPRRVVVTGGASGIGRAVVKAFADAGCRVAFCDVDSRQGPLTAQATGARFYPVDVSSAEALEGWIGRLIEEWGDIDVMVNNAGTSRFSALADTTADDFMDVIRINLLPVFVASRALARHRIDMMAAEGPHYGRIINIASTRARMSEAGTEAYSASKGGVSALTHALMMSVADLGMTVNCISPGWIDTGHHGELSAEDHAQHPSRRVGRPEDVARACLWLALPDNDFINGEDVVLDGGMTRRMIYC